MTTKQIEEAATNAVKNSFNYTEKLSSYISDNDKEPSWDGFVYIYNDSSQKKKIL